MQITEDWIRVGATQDVCKMLTDAGYQALFVGGCVRNALLGAPVGDIDIATDALPDQVMKLAYAAGLKPVPTGIDHGTITVVSGHIPHEVTTFREDVETFGRHATVAFGGDIRADARRRDFTMNALYARADGTVLDPLGGLDDLKAGHVRFIEDPAKRIQEDYLRILRFFRFHAWYGDPKDGLDADGLAACAMHLEGLSKLSLERVGAEIRKLLGAPDPAPSVAAMRSTGVLLAVLPGAEDRALAPLVHLETVTNAAPNAIRRLAVLGGGDVAARLRLSKAETRRLAHLRDGALGTMDAPELGYRHGAAEALDILLLRAALFEQPLAPDAQNDLARGAMAKCPVRAADFMPELSGAALGARLAELEQRWIASDFRLGRDDLV